MTPEEYLRIEDEQNTIIAAARKVINAAREEADNCPLPAKLRPAEPRDVVEGAVFWYIRDAESAAWYDGKAHYWSVVEEVQHPNDAFKAYVADDGCRYGIEGAFVEVKD